MVSTACSVLHKLRSRAQAGGKRAPLSGGHTWGAAQGAKLQGLAWLDLVELRAAAGPVCAHGAAPTSRRVLLAELRVSRAGSDVSRSLARVPTSTGSLVRAPALEGRPAGAPRMRRCVQSGEWRRQEANDALPSLHLAHVQPDQINTQ